MALYCIGSSRYMKETVALVFFQRGDWGDGVFDPFGVEESDCLGPLGMCPTCWS